MKTILKSLTVVALILNTTVLNAQNNEREKLTVLNVDVKGITLSPETAGDLFRREIEKLNIYDVTDPYDVKYIAESKKLKVDNCYGKLCLVELGNAIGSDKMMTGSIEGFADMLVITIRMVDVEKETIEKVNVKEFLFLPKELKTMVTITLNEMFGIDNDKTMVESLTKKNAFANSINEPKKDRLALDGPRMGFTMLTGTNAEIFKASKDNGGFDGFPMMFQFGYQFEKQYLNEGNFQALFEFIPMVTGLDQGLFIPSMTILHGLRGNKKGWEFAFGPTLGLMKKARGYYDPDLGWQLESAWGDSTLLNPHGITTRMDSRGNYMFSSGFVFAFGRSIRSGKLNIPFNAYIVPQRDGLRFGFSFGFNAKKPE
ncbi:MAG: hypothetical protein K1X56_02390 [Flavobacteriales bacterium]|nr:hypothetical protein [Flavobacteriales bacterium]